MKETVWKITDSGDIVYLYIEEPIIPSYISGTVKQIFKISALLNQNNIPHEIDRDAISMDGSIATTRINISVKANTSDVINILSSIGEKIGKPDFPKITINGSNIADKKFNNWIYV